MFRSDRPTILSLDCCDFFGGFYMLLHLKADCRIQWKEQLSERLVIIICDWSIPSDS